MNDPSLSMQAAIYSALTTYTPLIAYFNGATPRVYDRPPMDAVGKVIASFPYIQIGAFQVIDERDQFHDATSFLPTLHVWSRGVGKVEAITIMGMVITALDTILVPQGFKIITQMVEAGPHHGTDADGLTSHSDVTLRYRLGPTA